MILLDSSALVCALIGEPGADELRDLLEGARAVAVGAPMVLEAGIVLAARGLDARHGLGGYLDAIEAEVLEFRKEHQSVALGAFLRFGKGRHPAGLNYGDCMSYAFAQVTQMTLAYKGEDFGQTDLKRLSRLGSRA
ncbi:MAG: type II toxin-antitoxin system VapC family toxin [Bryobacteraceae bacterium]